jgi:serine/threonine-protein kinase
MLLMALAERAKTAEVVDAYPRPFGPYMLLKPLSEAEPTPVFLAAVNGSDKPWALKMVLGKGSTPAARQAVRTQVRVLRRLSSRQLAEVLDVHDSAEAVGLLMGFIDGATVGQVLIDLSSESEQIGPGLAATVARELLRGLADLHRFEGLELVHRNVSSRTAMVTYDGRVRLAGFVAPDDTPSITSPGYSTAGTALDFRYDLRSVGLLFWEMLTRQPVRDRRTTGMPPPSSVNAGVPPALDSVVAALLDGRFESAQSASEAVANTGATWSEARTAEVMRRLYAKGIEVAHDENARLLRAAASRFPEITRGAAAKIRYPEPGSYIGEYQLQVVIGEGGMGRVYRGIHTGSGKIVAIKVLHPHLRNPTVDERFRREARALAAVANRHIVAVTESGETPDGQFLFIVMEYLDGKPLAALLAEAGPLPIHRALQIMIQVADALEAAHGAGIIHRDIKPANIMLVRRGDESDYVKVLDFGLARLEADVALTVANETLGTTVYMAPEQARGQAATVKVDVYAVGEVLYETLTSQLPHRGDNPQELLVNKVKLDPTPIGDLRPDVPPALARAIMTALARDPASRPDSMRELRLALEACSAVERKQRRGLAARLGAVGVGVAAAIAVAMIWGRPVHHGPAATPGATAMTSPSVPSTAAPEGAPAVARTEERLPPVPAPATAPTIVGPPLSIQHRTSPTVSLPRADRRPAPSPGTRAKPPTVVSGERAPDQEEPTASQLLADAESAFEQGERIQAVELAKRAERAGAGIHARLALGKYYQRMRLFRDAAVEFQAVLAVEPDNQLAKIGLDTLPENVTPRKEP